MDTAIRKPANAMASDRAKGDRIRISCALLIAAALLYYGALQAWPFFADDAFISLRYSDRLLHGHGLTWNTFTPVEGYSNLLWTLLCALLGALGMDLAVAARALGIACTLATCALLAHRFRRTWGGALVAAAFAAAPSVPIWAIGGLEMPLVWLALSAGLLQCERAFKSERVGRDLLCAGSCFAAACLTRPDAPLFLALAVAVTALAYWPRGGRPMFNAVLWLSLVPAIAIGAQLLFRLAYYGDYLPNTARVKLGNSTELWRGGLGYLRFSWPAFMPLVAPAVLCSLANAKTVASWPAHFTRTPLLARLPFVMLLFTTLLTWPTYVVIIGGDIFPGWRLLSPMLLPAAILTGLLCETLALSGRKMQWLAIAIALVSITSNRIGAHFDPETRRAAEERFEHDYLALGTMLLQAFEQQQPLFAVQAAGALCYASRLPSLDMFGLNDRAIALDPAPRVESDPGGAFGAAHRRGRPEYLLQRAPDLVSFDEMLIPIDAAGMAFVDSPAFTSDYRCVLFDAKVVREHGTARGQELVLPLWVRSQGCIGITTGKETVRVPAFLLGSLRHSQGHRYPAPNAPPEQIAKFAAEHPEVLRWWSRPVVAAPAAITMAMQLEVRQPGTFTLGPFDLSIGEWSPALTPAQKGCRVELTHEAAMGTLSLIVDPAAQLPLRLDAIELRRAR